VSSARWLFVDFDGTLVESLGVARSVYETFVKMCGGRPDDAEFRALNGPSLREIVDIIAIRLSSSVDRTELCRRYTDLWQLAYAGVAPKSGATGLLQEARARGVRVAIVSSAKATFLDAFVSRHNWGDLVDRTISGDDVPRSKPDPAIYLLALERSGTEPNAVEAIEDSVSGVVAAARAGLRVVGLADGGEHASSSDELRRAGAARVISRLSGYFGSEDA
jgi:HAD superfamily hydrolase (TIGR01509 family)